MKRSILSLFLIGLFALIGLQAANAATMQYTYLKADGAIGSTADTPTWIVKIEAMCEKGPLSATNVITTAPCYFGIRKYADVATGPILTKDNYMVSVSGGTHTFDTVQWNGQFTDLFLNGAYFDALTGTVNVKIYFLK